MNSEQGPLERQQRRKVERRKHSELRQHHARAIFLATRDDDQPRHLSGRNVARLDALIGDPTIVIDLPAMLDVPTNTCIVDPSDCAPELPRD